MPLLQTELERGAQYAETVAAAATEIDGRGLRKIFGRAGDFADIVVGIDDLRQHLVVEDKVVRVTHKRDAFEDLAGESAVASMVL